MKRATEVAPEAARALLDVNVLIALLDADHMHHRPAVTWLSANIDAGWASCAITQNACVRIMSQPGYPAAMPAAGVAARLRKATQSAHHRFVASTISLLDPELFDTAQLLGPKQVTDVYLLGLAVSHGLRLVTFNRAISLRAIRSVTAGHLVSI